MATVVKVGCHASKPNECTCDVRKHGTAHASKPKGHTRDGCQCGTYHANKHKERACDCTHREAYHPRAPAPTSITLQIDIRQFEVYQPYVWGYLGGT